jgi:hypothetical protein
MTKSQSAMYTEKIADRFGKGFHFIATQNVLRAILTIKAEFAHPPFGGAR